MREAAMKADGGQRVVAEEVSNYINVRKHGAQSYGEHRRWPMFLGEKPFSDECAGYAVSDWGHAGAVVPLESSREHATTETCGRQRGRFRSKRCGELSCTRVLLQ